MKIVIVAGHAGYAFIGCCLAMAVALGDSSRADALGTEEVGNKPIVNGFNFNHKLLAAINVPERVYWYEVNGNPFFYFRGTSRDINEAIRTFAAIPAEKREIILLPSPGTTKTFGGEQRIEYDWCLHVPDGLTYRADPDLGDTRATLTIHIPEVRPTPPADLAQVRRWIAALDDNDFKVRDMAARALEKLGRSAGPALRDALQATTSPEVQTRIEQLLGRLEIIELDALQFPKELKIIGMETILDRCRRALKSEKASVRGHAIISLAFSSARSSEVLPELLKILETEKDEYALRSVASALGSLGAAAKPALPTLREQVKLREGAVKQSFEQTLEIVEKATISADAETEAKKRTTIRDDISRLLKDRTESKTP